MENQEESGITFTGFILSLATTAAVHFGDIADPGTGEPVEPNIVGGRSDDRNHRDAAG